MMKIQISFQLILHLFLGIKHIYNSGIISDAAINPGDFAEFYVVINIDTDKEIKYFLRDIRWEYFE